MKQPLAWIAYVAIGGCAWAQSAVAQVPLPLAVEAAEAAIAACKADGYSVTVVVLEPGSVAPRLVLRSDGARDMTVEIARRKAYTAIKSGMTSAAFSKTLPGGPPPPPEPAAPGQPPSIPGPVNGDPSLIALAGGVPIKLNDSVLGGIGVSGAHGGEKDESCAQAGLAKILGRLK